MIGLDSMLRKMPVKLRKRLNKNRFALSLHKYLVLRPIYTKSVVTGITIELTDKCNMACSYCPKSLGIGVRGGHMDFELFKEIVDEACELALIKQIPLVGFGEPLLYPHLLDAIQYIKSKNSAIRTTLTTNGTLLNVDWARRMAAIGLDQITISVNAVSREQYKEINGADLYEKVVANTCTFLDSVNDSSSTMRILVQVLEGPNSPQEIETFRTYWRPGLGRCGEIQVQPFVNWAGLITTPSDKIENKQKAYPCAHLQNSWIITREGHALACCMVFPGDQGDLVLGNVKGKSLKELYMEGRINGLRRLNVQGKLYQLSPCKYCDAYKTVPNVWIRNPLYPISKKKWL